MTFRNRVAFPLASAFALFAYPLLAQTAPEPMQASDLVTMPRLGSPTVSPDGTIAVYSVTTTDPEEFARDSQLYMRSLDNLNATPVALDLKGSGASFGGDGWRQGPQVGALQPPQGRGAAASGRTWAVRALV